MDLQYGLFCSEVVAGSYYVFYVRDVDGHAPGSNVPNGHTACGSLICLYQLVSYIIPATQQIGPAGIRSHVRYQWNVQGASVSVKS